MTPGQPTYSNWPSNAQENSLFAGNPSSGEIFCHLFLELGDRYSSTASHSKPRAQSGVMSGQEFILDLVTNRCCNLEERGKVGVEGLNDKEGVKGFNGVNNCKDGVTGRFFTLTDDCGITGCDLFNIDVDVDAKISPNLVGTHVSAIILMELFVFQRGVMGDTGVIGDTGVKG